MYDPSERRVEIDNKLEREMKNLKLLKEKVTRSSQLAKGMMNILSSSDCRLAHVEETILPIYNQTESLQRQQKNLRNTLKMLDHVIVFYDTSKKMEPIIRAGPSINKNGNSGLQIFLQAMGKLQAAMEYFRVHNSDSPEYIKVKTLYNSGGDALNQEFKELMHHYSEPVPLLTLLDLVSPAEETQHKEEPTSLNQLPSHIRAELQDIASWFNENDNDEYVDVYVSIRGNMLHKSIQNLKDHQQSSSGSSVHSNSSVNSPVLRKKFRQETSNSGASKLLQYLFEKKTKRMLLKASPSVEHLGFAVNSRRSAMEIRDDGVDEQEMVNYLMCVMALQKLMQSEKTLMLGIVPLDEQPKAYENLIQDALNMVIQEGESIAIRTKKCISHHEYTTLLVVFPILKHLQSMLPEYKEIVKDCSETLSSKFSTTYDILHSTAAKALDDFIESIHSESSTQLPKDGTVHELTSNTLVFLEQLFDFSDMIGGILAQKFEYNNALTIALISQLVGGYGERDRNKIILGMYIYKILSELYQTLCNKSKLYSDIYLRAVFRLNNTYQILKCIQESGLLSLVQLSKPDFEPSYQKMINDDKEAYTQSWNKLLSNIWPLEDLPSLNSNTSKMREKDRTIIKEKFAGFNKGIEEIVKVQHVYSIADEELRKSLKQDNKNFIIPKYKDFFEKYAKLSFTKNPKKYIKYTPDNVSSMIDQLFDVAA